MIDQIITKCNHEANKTLCSGCEKENRYNNLILENKRIRAEQSRDALDGQATMEEAYNELNEANEEIKRLKDSTFYCNDCQGNYWPYSAYIHHYTEYDCRRA